MDKALRYEINKNIPVIVNKIYPTNAPEGKEAPYLVYIRDAFKQTKDLDGFKKRYEVTYLLNVFGNSYIEMEPLTEQVKNLVISFIDKEIGQDGIFVEDVKLNNVTSTYEYELKLYRGIIDATFIFVKNEKEE